MNHDKLTRRFYPDSDEINALILKWSGMRLGEWCGEATFWKRVAKYYRRRHCNAKKAYDAVLNDLYCDGAGRSGTQPIS